MSRVDVTQDVVLERVVVRLRDQLSLDPRQCYETLDAMAPPTVPKGGEYFIAVAPGEGSFVEGEQADPNVSEEWSVTVTIYTRILLDSPDHDEAMLRDSARGLLVLKKKVLAALVGHDLEDKDGDTFLRNLLFARRTFRPAVVERTGTGERTVLGMLSIDFGVDFDWDLD